MSAMVPMGDVLSSSEREDARAKSAADPADSRKNAVEHETTKTSGGWKKPLFFLLKLAFSVAMLVVIFRKVVLRDGAEVASIEQILLHVDMAAGKTCPAAPAVLDRLLPLAKAHRALPRPEAAGRHVGQGKA